ncbi:uncharacterized protein ACHE_41133S [Aspergillus chevalieri]|uniref:Uncharacterized protein n=1 Tax=Aspergillus chevalieri TaxID=182096 RepID=A0A7R7VR78_ASPCH|nr:uncharacterized protein ACHE_41133S [Aspergillus chevalieri]BCR88569.1 hypothetical protein ACHE_41133S [Aspergillus chevalieri]
MAYAGFRFVKGLLAPRHGETMTEEAYVYLPDTPGGKEISAELCVEYFAVKIALGEAGATKPLPIGIGKISESEKGLLEVAVRASREYRDRVGFRGVVSAYMQCSSGHQSSHCS